MKRFIRRASLVVCVGLGFVASYRLAPVHAQQAQALAIEGGTLIDGNGGAPVLNAVIVI